MNYRIIEQETEEVLREIETDIKLSNMSTIDVDGEFFNVKESVFSISTFTIDLYVESRKIKILI